MHALAKPAHLNRFLCPSLRSIAGGCVPGGVRMVSTGVRIAYSKRFLKGRAQKLRHYLLPSFARVRGRRIPRTSPLRSSRKFLTLGMRSAYSAISPERSCIWPKWGTRPSVAWFMATHEGTAPAGRTPSKQPTGLGPFHPFGGCAVTRPSRRVSPVGSPPGFSSWGDPAPSDRGVAAFVQSPRPRRLARDHRRGPLLALFILRLG